MLRKMILIGALLLTLAPLSAGAAGLGYMERDGSLAEVQGPAPHASVSQILTVNSTTIDMTGRLWWELYPPVSGCKYRIMPTAVKGSYPQFTAPAGAATGYNVNRSGGGFLNYSGCTLGELKGG